MKTNRRIHKLFRLVQLTSGIGLLVFLILGFSIRPVYANGGSGSIWTTDDSNTFQDKNLYAQDEDVYVRGENLDPNAQYTLIITGLPGGASSKPNQDVATLDVTTDGDGNFYVFAYKVANDDDGVFKVSVNGKQDNYSVRGTQPPPDECSEALLLNVQGQCVEDDDPPTPPNTPELIPVTGIDRSSGQNVVLNLAAFSAGVGLIIKGLSGKKE